MRVVRKQRTQLNHQSFSVRAPEPLSGVLGSPFLAGLVVHGGARVSLL